MWLHRYAKLVSAATVLLIVAGGLVTSTGSGLAVPDWPTSYGWNMFTFPMKHMVGGIFYEHGHRLIASGVGFLTIILAFWIWKAEPRRWMRMLGFTALAAVCVQGLLGGITVLYFLPTAVSTAHAGLAQIFFCLTIAIALFTSTRLDAARRTSPSTIACCAWSRRQQPPSFIFRLSSAPRCGTRMRAWRFPISRWCSADCFRPSGRRRLPFTYAHRVGALHRDARDCRDRRPRLVSPLAAPRASPSRADARVPRARASHARGIRHLVAEERRHQHGPRRRWRADARDVARPHAPIASHPI